MKKKAEKKMKLGAIKVSKLNGANEKAGKTYHTITTHVSLNCTDFC
ncbi:MAG: hypothetical protein J7623_28005 [Chitinophaga sp.]|nr:hypothetical protein [Chitinophaga sp.]MBO9732519.1 hypothetical protein [Chitinophaga sp.]